MYYNQHQNTPRQYTPVCSQFNETECSRVKEYLIEFLEELREFKKNNKINSQNKTSYEMSSTNLATELKCDENALKHNETSAFNLVKTVQSDLENKNDYIQVRDYLIEFLEEYKKSNKSKTNQTVDPTATSVAVTQPTINISKIPNNSDNNNSSICPEILNENKPKDKVIKIQVRIDKPGVNESDIQVELEKEVESISNKAAEINEKFPKTAMNAKKAEASHDSSSSPFSSPENKKKAIIYEKIEPNKPDIMRRVPKAKLDMLDSITLKKIRDQYKQDQMPYKGSSRRSLLVKANISDNVKPINRNKNINSLDRASRSSNRHSSYEVLEDFYKNSKSSEKAKPDQILLKLISPKYNEKHYDFEKDFQRHMQQSDPYFKLPSKFPNLRLNI